MNATKKEFFNNLFLSQKKMVSARNGTFTHYWLPQLFSNHNHLKTVTDVHGEVKTCMSMSTLVNIQDDAIIRLYSDQ